MERSFYAEWMADRESFVKFNIKEKMFSKTMKTSQRDINMHCVKGDNWMTKCVKFVDIF